MPKVDTTVGQLVDMIASGQLRLPELQRRYVWPATRVRDLLDSLYRGYPSGTILVWETDADVPGRDFAVAQTQAPFTPKLLLDGQQRLTSLSAVTRGEPLRLKNRVRPIEIAFNVQHPEGAPTEVTEVDGDEATGLSDDDDEETDAEEETSNTSVNERLRNRTFVVGTASLYSEPRWIKVSEIFKQSDWALLKGLVSTPDDPKYDVYSKRLQKVRAIREYPYVMHVLDRSLSYEEVAEIFVRVNSLGMKLRGSDLALAQITARWRDSLRLFEEFAEECEGIWFTFDIGLLVKTLVVFATKQSRFRTVNSIQLESFPSAWQQAKDGLRFAINFLRANGHIEDESLLSSPFLVIPIAVFSVLKNQQLTEREEKDLLLWLFLANAKGHYSQGSSETVLDVDVGLLFRGGGPAELLESLKQQVGRITFEAGDLAGRGPRNPLFAATYLALRASDAKDWRSGLGLSLTHQGKSHTIQFHHIFPKSVLTRLRIEQAEVNEIANLAFISGKQNQSLGNKEPSAYLPDIVEARGTDALMSQCIPLDEDLWKLENYSQFLEYRRTHLAACLNRFISEISAERKLAVDVAALLSDGESSVQEFKSSARFNAHTKAADKVLESVIAKTIAGFMNSSGGTLFIGVNDAGIPIGVSNDLQTLGRRDRDGYEQFLVGLVATHLGKERCAQVAFSFHAIDDVEICMARVTPSPVPTYVSEGNDQKFYVRAGNTTQPMSVQEAVGYIQQHWRSG